MHYRLRSFIRVPINSDILMTTRDVSFNGVLADISLGGVYVSTHESLPVTRGHIFKLNFALPFESGDKTVNVNGMALRTEPDGIAFRFLESAPEILRVLFSFIYQENIGL